MIMILILFTTQVSAYKSQTFKVTSEGETTTYTISSDLKKVEVMLVVNNKLVPMEQKGFEYNQQTGVIVIQNDCFGFASAFFITAHSNSDPIVGYLTISIIFLLIGFFLYFLYKACF